MNCTFRNLAIARSRASGVWLKVLALSFLDWFSVKIFLEPIIRRTRRGDIKT
jgi:hypothetical protein